MINTFKWRLTLSYMALILLFILLGGFLGIRYYDELYAENLSQSMLAEVKLAAEILKDYDFSQPQKEITALTEQIGGDIGGRVTLVAPDGTVMADSQENIAQMSNHKSFPEIREALRGDPYTVRRVDPVSETDTMYVATPVMSDDQVQGVIRLAVPPTGVKNLIKQLWWVILFTVIPAGVIALMVSLKYVNRMTGPLSDMTQVARSMAEGNLKRRVLYKRDDEIGILASAMNTMASRLDEKITEISEVKGRLETVLENTVNGIILVDSNEQISFINPTARILLGVGEKDVIGKRQIEVTRSYALTHSIDQVIKDRKPIRQEFVLHNFGEKVVQTAIVPIEDEWGLRGILVVVNDITELKRLETIRKDFVANVSHELKTPITAISGFAETLIEETTGNQTCQEFSRIIYDETLRLARLVESHLELSRIETIDPNLQLEKFDIKDCIAKALERFDLQLAEKNLTAETKFPDESVLVTADWDRITQVMFNLIDNAINYSEEGNLIEITVENREQDVLVEVTDYGIGIPQQETTRIFERFYRVDKARSRKGGGSGLGLSIVKHIIEVHGGNVDLHSQIGEGSTFFFTLPKKQSDQ
ncbi:MAG: cell wall metabolism sensor histidine kinase WalK [Syntrophomonadaceae bacterium]|nr:cell wall metabolism sensor histidine kinase WalK [Syntrophomonadaceae bacterium]